MKKNRYNSRNRITIKTLPRNPWERKKVSIEISKREDTLTKIFQKRRKLSLEISKKENTLPERS